MKKIIFCVLALGSFVAYADDSGFYVGVGGSAYANTLTSASSFSNPISHNGQATFDSASLVLPGVGGGYRIFGGYNFNRFLGIEAGFNQNFAVDVLSPVLTLNTLGTSNSLQLNTYDIEAVGYLPIPLTNFKFLGKLGIDYNAASLAFAGLPAGYSYAASNASGGNYSLLAGVGVEWDVFNTLLLRLEYVNYGNVTLNSAVGELGTANNNVVTMNVGFKF